MSRASGAWWLGGWLAVQALLAQGEIVIDRTRLIYPAAAREITLNLRNAADGPRLVQAWIDAGDARTLPEYSDVPFTLTPPIQRLEAGKGLALRVSYQPPARETEHETVYWLNVLGIRPTDAADNSLQFAFRTRIKLFLRPPSLAGQADEAAQALQWTVRDGTLQVRNPGAYHVTLSSLVATVDGVPVHHPDPPMLTPKAETALMPLPAAGAVQVRFSSLDDHGTARVHQATLRGAP